jgi:hypothetical protein
MAYRDDLQAALARAEALEKENTLLKMAAVRILEVHPSTCAIASPPWKCDCGVAQRARRYKVQRATAFTFAGAVLVGIIAAILYTNGVF